MHYITLEGVQLLRILEKKHVIIGRCKEGAGQIQLREPVIPLINYN